MKSFKLFTVGVLILACNVLKAQDATAIVKRANEKMQGEKSSFSNMTMRVVRPTWERTVGFKSWTLGNDLSMVLITSPAQDKGQSFLRREREMWNWNPTISRMIKLPTSMLSDGWMGSDFTNDDLLNQSSVVVDFTHEIVGSEIIGERECYKIELIPKEDAPVVWGKIFMWISKKDDLQMKTEYFDEDDFLVKTEVVNKIGVMDGRTIPILMELIPADEEGHKTVIEIQDIQFNINLSTNYFSQQNMKRLR